jgi:hypothetical protein
MAEMLRSLELRQYVVSTDRRPADVSNRTADSDQAADQQDKPRASSIRAIAGPSKVKDPLVLLVTAPRRQRQDAARVCLEVAASRHVRAQAQGASASVTGLRGAGRRTSDCGSGSGSGLRSIAAERLMSSSRFAEGMIGQLASRDPCETGHGPCA